MKRELNYIGERIKRARESKGITMEELGIRADVSGQHIGLLERSRSGISVQTLVKIAEALEVTTDSLLIKNKELENLPCTSRAALNFLLDGCTEEELSFFTGFIRLYRERHSSAKREKNIE